MARAWRAVSTWPVTTTRWRRSPRGSATAHTFWLGAIGSSHGSGLSRCVAARKNETTTTSPSTAAASAPAWALGPRPSPTKSPTASSMSPSASANGCQPEVIEVNVSRRTV